MDDGFELQVYRKATSMEIIWSCKLEASTGNLGGSTL
jgi:hypothetical protein